MRYYPSNVRGYKRNLKDIDMNLVYIYLKLAKAFKNSLIQTFNTGTIETVNEFVQRYNKLREEVEENVLFGQDITSLPYVSELRYIDDEAYAKFNELLMATGQMIALLEGLSGSFEKEIKRLEEENIKLKKELRELTPLIPHEVTIKVPAILQKTINEANDTYRRGNLTATGILLRKIVDNALHLKCRMKNCEDKLRNPSTNEFYNLPKKIDICAKIGIIRPNRARDLKRIKLYGDSAAHSLKIELTPQDIEDAKVVARLLLEELFG